MQITDELIGYIGDLSRLYLSDEEKERAKKVLPANWHVAASAAVTESLGKIIGEKNVKVMEKGLKR